MSLGFWFWIVPSLESHEWVFNLPVLNPPHTCIIIVLNFDNIKHYVMQFKLTFDVVTFKAYTNFVMYRFG